MNHPAFIANVARWAVQDDFFRSGPRLMLKNVQSKLRLLRAKVTSRFVRRDSGPDIRDVLRVWQFPDKHRAFLEAHHRALDLTRRLPFDVEYWPIPNPTAVEGSREQRLDAYRAVRDDLLKRIKARFAWRSAGSV